MVLITVSVRIFGKEPPRAECSHCGKATWGFRSGEGYRPLICAIAQSLADICLSRRLVVAKLLLCTLGVFWRTFIVLLRYLWLPTICRWHSVATISNL